MQLKEELDQLLSAEQLSHAYLFEGDNMFEMKTTAMYFAEQILCNNEGNCITKVQTMNHPDFMYIQTEETTIKKQQIEELLRKMNQKPIESKYKVYIIEAFDKLTVQGENSILKFLEEPPPNTIALLLTTKKDQILPTIHSRCQLIHFKPASKETFIEDLQASDISAAIAHTLSFVTSDKDEAISLTEEQLFTQLRKSVAKLADLMVKDHQMALIYLIDCIKVANTRPLQQLFLNSLNAYFQDVLHAKIELDSIKAFPDLDAQIVNTSTQLSLSDISNYIQCITEANRKLAQNVNATLVFEQMVIKWKR